MDSSMDEKAIESIIHRLTDGLKCDRPTVRPIGQKNAIFTFYSPNYERHFISIDIDLMQFGSYSSTNKDRLTQYFRSEDHPNYSLKDSNDDLLDASSLDDEDFLDYATKDENEKISNCPAMDNKDRFRDYTGEGRFLRNCINRGRSVNDNINRLPKGYPIKPRPKHPVKRQIPRNPMFNYRCNYDHWVDGQLMTTCIGNLNDDKYIQKIKQIIKNL